MIIELNQDMTQIRIEDDEWQDLNREQKALLADWIKNYDDIIFHSLTRYETCDLDAIAELNDILDDAL